MTPAVAAAVLLAAVTHATWNAIAHTIRDQLVAFTLIAGGGAVLGAVAVCLAPFPAAGAWPYLIASAVLHVGYQALLMRSFSLGDFGQMYPIARGTAPGKRPLRRARPTPDPRAPTTPNAAGRAPCWARAWCPTLDPRRRGGSTEGGGTVSE